MGPRFMRHLWKFRLWNDEHAQDLVEYALLAGMVAVASVLFLPGMANSMITVYSRLASKLVEAAA